MIKPTHSVSVSDLTKCYKEVYALDSVSLDFDSGSFTALQGPSGSGKSTLLYLLSGLLQPNSGKVIINDTNLATLNEAKRSAFRAKHIGMVFQNFHLLPYLSVLENVMIPSLNKTLKPNEARERALQLLKEFELSHRLKHHPSELSAGECQRVAIARAIITSPSLLLADEPTGNLDNDNTEIILNHLKAYAALGNTVLMVTHSDNAAKQAHKSITLSQGKLVSKS